MLSLTPGQNRKPIAISKNGDIVYIEAKPGLKKNTIEADNLQPLPSAGSQREVIYVSGASGSGKSYFTKCYTKMWQKMHPEKDVYIFSKIQDDESLQGIKEPYYIPIDESLILDPINLQDMRDSLVILDDVDQVGDKQITEALNNLIGGLLEHSRHYNTWVVITSHLLNGNDKKRSRTIHNECTATVLFPHAINHMALKYWCNNYLGISDKKTLEAIQNSTSRYVWINKRYPMHVIHSGGAYCL